MQVRLPTIQVDENTRRAIRFVQTGRQTMCSRKAAQDFLLEAQQKAVKNALYRLYGNDIPEAVLAGADAELYSDNEDDNPEEPEGNSADAQPLVNAG